MTTSRRTTVRGIILGLAIASVPMLALATHSFSDVPDNAFYHDSVSNVAGAGLTAGCGSGTTFCPEDEVTRGQMATFLGRGLGRLAYATGSADIDAGGGNDVVVATASIVPGGAVAGRTNMIKVDGMATVSCDAACTVELALTEGTNTSRTILVILDAAGTEHVALTWAVEVTTASPAEAVDLNLEANSVSAAQISANGDITALFVPFGPDGGNALEPAP